MVKKIALGVLLVFVLGIIGLFLFLGAPYDPDKSPYYDMEPPEDIQRTQDHPEIGQRTTFVKKSHETDHQYTLVEVELEPGEGNAVHYHNRFAEIFFPISGTLGVHREGEDLKVESGDSVIVESGEHHRFFNPSDDEAVTFEVRLEPGAPGFEKALYLMYGLSRDGLVDENGLPENIYHTALFVVLGDTRAPGVRSLLSPLMWRIAGRAQRQGIEEEVMESYYVNMTE